MKDIEKAIFELKRFSTKMLTMYPPAALNVVIKFEEKLNVALPEDYKYLISISNGISLMGGEVLGLKDISGESDLFDVYDYEHFKVKVPQPRQVVPFSPDGRGNFYCFDTNQSTNNGQSCAIIFWNSNYDYNDADQPERTHNSISEFILECIIEWTLEDYDHFGHKKE